MSKKKKIIIVDDEPMMRLLLKQIFNSQYEVHVFNDGKEALSWMYAGSIPDAAVIDLQMPEMNGYELLDHLKKSGFFEKMPVFVLSAEETSSDRIKCLEMGAEDYVTKPFNPKELKIRVERVLKTT
ncbi:MAG: response regulator transcription factor [Schleiferiaceae bacterium]|jgi:DNA-binding response OmpR family regulator|nr:response regulator transcription factor [Schleiferiaceae bacterium]